MGMGEGRGQGGKGGEMIHTFYAYMNKRLKKGLNYIIS
jgi:hypothetical protein